MRILLSLLSILFCPIAFGQQLSLKEAAELTYSNHPAIKATEYQQLAAKRSRQAALGLYSPQINIHSAWAHTQKDIAIDINPLKQLLGSLDIAPLLNLDWRYTIQNRTLGFVEADIAIPLFTGGKIIAANRAAKATESVAELQSEIKHNSIFTELVVRYFGYILAANVVNVRQLAADALERHCQDMESLFDNGMATNTELLYVKYRRNSTLQELRTAQAELKTAHSALSTTIGIDNISKLSTPIFTVDVIEDLDYFQQLAKENNPELKMADSQLSLANQNIAIHRADFFPEITAIAAGGLTHKVTNLLPRWAIGIGVNFKLFDGLRREHNYMAAKSTYNRVEELTKEADNNIRLLVESLYNQTISQLEATKSRASGVAFAKEYLLSQQMAYSENMATSTAIVDATLELAVAQISHLEAAYKFDISLAKLLEAAGESQRLFYYLDNITTHSVHYED